MLILLIYYILNLWNRIILSLILSLYYKNFRYNYKIILYYIFNSLIIYYLKIPLYMFLSLFSSLFIFSKKKNINLNFFYILNYFHLNFYFNKKISINRKGINIEE